MGAFKLLDNKVTRTRPYTSVKCVRSLLGASFSLTNRVRNRNKTNLCLVYSAPVIFVAYNCFPFTEFLIIGLFVVAHAGCLKSPVTALFSLLTFPGGYKLAAVYEKRIASANEGMQER